MTAPLNSAAETTPSRAIVVSDACSALEGWRNADKSHAVQLSIDNGYGASCWDVTFYRGSRKVVVSEVSFFEGPERFEKDGDLWVCLPESDDFPGLAATVMFGIAAAREFFQQNVKAMATPLA